MNSKVLYISYDGMLEPLGQSQVLRYLERLAKDNSIFLVSFEKEDDWLDTKAMGQLNLKIAKAGIIWKPLKYHKRPSGAATAFDIIMGTGLCLWLCLRHQIHIVHARSYVSSVMALVLKKVLSVKFVFDMRGFWADERVDGDIWPKNSRLYHVAKWFEKKFLLNADYVVSLTQAGVDEIKRFPYLQTAMPKFEVITTCTDLELFQPSLELNGDRPLTVGYIGSAGVWYLFDEAIRCFALLLEIVPDAKLHILNRGEHRFIRETISKHALPESSVTLESTDHAGVVRAMQTMDAGLFFIKPVFSKKASAPTKLGEFLGCGVPCLGNAGVGDMGTILEAEQVGVALSDFDDISMRNALIQMLNLMKEPDIKVRCRETALRHFSLEDGVNNYNHIYQDLSV